MPPPITWFSTSRASRSGSVRGSPGKPIARWACSIDRFSTASGRLGQRGLAAGHDRGGTRGSEVRLDVGDDLLVVDQPGCGDDERRRSVVLPEERSGCLRERSLRPCPRSRRLPPERVLGEQRLEHQGVHSIVRRVVVHGQLFEDDLALAVDVVVAERRRG